MFYVFDVIHAKIIFLCPYLTPAGEGISGTNTKKRDEFNKILNP